MASQSDKTRGQVTCVVEISSEIVDAGAEMTLHASVSCVPACDMRGQTLSIKDHVGAETGKVELVEFDVETKETAGEFVAKAPLKPGAYTWSATSPEIVKNGVSYSEVFTPLSFTVKPHTTSIVVWDTPSAVIAGERFGAKVGIKCSSNCHLTNRDFRIYDAKGAQVSATLLGDRWPGTTGLYSAEVELEAPAEEGLYTWSVKIAGTGVGIPHDEGSVSFGVRVVSHPECLVTIETVDKVSQTPLTGARVGLHPYRAVTDEHGIAEVRVPKGKYQLFASQTMYVTLGLPIEVSTDMTVRMELELEPVTERN